MEHPAAGAAAAGAAAAAAAAATAGPALLEGMAGAAAATGVAEGHEEGQQGNEPDAPVLVQTPLVRQLLLLRHPLCTACPPACLLSMLAAR